MNAPIHIRRAPVIAIEILSVQRTIIHSHGACFVDKRSFVFVLFLLGALVCVRRAIKPCSIPSNATYAQAHTFKSSHSDVNQFTVCSWKNKMARSMQTVQCTMCTDFDGIKADIWRKLIYSLACVNVLWLSARWTNVNIHQNIVDSKQMRSFD